MKQVFQTQSPLRWKKFKWTVYSLFALLMLGAVISLLSLYTHDLSVLPQLSDLKKGSLSHQPDNKQLAGAAQVTSSPSSNKQPGGEQQSYHFSNNNIKGNNSNNHKAIKAAFYVNWDLQSYKSLRGNIDHLNTVMPEWFSLNNSNDSISVDIDMKALELMQSHHVDIIPMLTNFYDFRWNGENVHRIITNETNRKKIIKSILANLKKYNFRGINIDFEDLVESTDEYVILFQKELYESLHQENFLVTQDIPPGNADYNIEELQRYNDYLVIMAYDEHHPSTKPGDIASINWVQHLMEKVLSVVPPEKIIMGICAYGYDWEENQVAQDISFARAMSVAKAHQSEIVFDPISYSLHFDYKDDKGAPHSVYFNDAVSGFNTMRLGYENNVAGFAAWRLGEEDVRLWSFFNKNLDRESLATMDRYAKELLSVSTIDNVAYDGEGDILNVVATPSLGTVTLEADNINKLFSYERFEKLPTGYEVHKIGKQPNKIVLSFDDGPDPLYTDKIIDILDREQIPASFFLLGLNAQNNIPLVKKLFAKGYELGNHSYTHPNFSEASPFRIKLELRSTRRLIQCITGCNSILFRPPYSGDDLSEYSEDITPMALSKEEHYYTIASSIDPRDWEKNVSADEIVKRVIESENNGNIILLHDGGGNRQETIKALPEIIHHFKSKGYTFTTIADLMGKTRNDVMPLSDDSNEKLIKTVNLLIASSFFYSNKLFSGLFLLVILLVMLRMLIVAILALTQKLKSKKVRPASLYGNDWVSIIVPAYNEEATIVKTIQSLLSSTYDKLEIIIVDDGSTDGTQEKILSNFGENENVKLFTKRNSGKAAALNFGIQHAKGTIVVCIDADTQLKNDAIGNLLNYFDDEKTAAVAGNVKVGNEFNWLTKWQSIEYITGQNFDKRAFDLLNCITIVPGAVGAFRKDLVLQAGGFSHQTLAEDCDLTMLLLEKGYSVKYSPLALAYTEVPESFSMFLRQRFRWTFGVMQSFWKHRSSFLNPKTGTMGMIAMPNILLFQFILPAIAPVVDVLMLMCLLEGQGMQIIGYYFLFISLDAAGALLAFSFEKEKTGRLWLLIPQRIVYRWLMGFVLYKAILKAIRGELMNWGDLERTGNVEMETIPVEDIPSPLKSLVTNLKTKGLKLRRMTPGKILSNNELPPNAERQRIIKAAERKTIFDQHQRSRFDKKN